LLAITFFSTVTYATEMYDNPANRLSIDKNKTFKLPEFQSDVVKVNINTLSANPGTEFTPPLFSARKVHQYFGITTIALAGLTALSAPDECENRNCTSRDINGIHSKLATATIAAAAAAIATGLYAHWDDFSLQDGWIDPDNLHVLLGVTGAVLMVYAVNKSANSSVPVSHAAIAETGAVLMVVAIKLTW